MSAERTAAIGECVVICEERGDEFFRLAGVISDRETSAAMKAAGIALRQAAAAMDELRGTVRR